MYFSALHKYAPRDSSSQLAAGGPGFGETLQKAVESVLMSIVAPTVVRVAKQGLCRVQWRLEKGNIRILARSVTVAHVFTFNRLSLRFRRVVLSAVRLSQSESMYMSPCDVRLCFFERNCVLHE